MEMMDHGTNNIQHYIDNLNRDKYLEIQDKREKG